MQNVKKLFDFHESEADTPAPTTHVVEQSSREDVDYYKTPVYITTEQGFKNYCSTCPRLIKKETLENPTWKYRVVCSVLKCEKQV